MFKYDGNLIENFRNYLIHLGYSKTSVYMLPNCTKEFLAYHNNPSPETFTGRHIQIFYEYLHERPCKRKPGGLSETMISHYIYSLRSFFNYLEATGQIKYNPISVMKFKRPQANQRQPLTPEEINLLFEAAGSLKETALLHIFYSCGLRRSEGVALNISDIHFKSCLLYVREGKGRKRRAIPMTAKVTSDLESYYLNERNTHLKAHHNSEAFILNKRGRRMTGNKYNDVLKEIAIKSGITKNISLHYLRHSIATHLLENGLSLEYVRDFLGHRHLEATQIYTKVSNYQISKL